MIPIDTCTLKRGCMHWTLKLTQYLELDDDLGELLPVLKNDKLNLLSKGLAMQEKNQPGAGLQV